MLRCPDNHYTYKYVSPLNVKLEAICLFVLRFYSPVNSFWSCLAPKNISNRESCLTEMNYLAVVILLVMAFFFFFCFFISAYIQVNQFTCLNQKEN